MSKINVEFVVAGERKVVSAEEGKTLMEVALDNGIDEIVAECGGACVCATCHCLPEAQWLSQLPEPGPDEEMMLEYSVDNRQENSRLACQITLSKALDGLVVSLPQ